MPIGYESAPHLAPGFNYENEIYERVEVRTTEDLEGYGEFDLTVDVLVETNEITPFAVYYGGRELNGKAPAGSFDAAAWNAVSDAIDSCDVFRNMCYLAAEDAS